MSIGLRRARTERPGSAGDAGWAAGSPPSALDWALELAVAERACCCSAGPAFAAVLPAADPDSDPVALLLCGHHYRACRDSLLAQGASVYDRDGGLVTGDLWSVS